MMNFNRLPYFSVRGVIWKGWDSISKQLRQEIKESQKERFLFVVECYQGVYDEELLEGLCLLSPDLLIHSDNAFYSEEKIREKTLKDVTDDALFGYMTRLTYDDFLDKKKVHDIQLKIEKSTGLVIVYGHAAALVVEEYDCLVYADMARWEIQLRQRRHEVNNLGIHNREEPPGIQYKRGFFVDWRVCDRLKQELFDKADYWLDTNKKNEPKMIATQTMLDGLNAIVQTPFSVVPYFDEGPWGGQWMKSVCGLDETKQNYAWCFNCVPEENSLLFEVQNELFEMPSINLVFYKSKELLGELVESRFGKEFPIRFDFLDTMNGGNLSLQVHPTTQYIHETFGMYYTQDESYYLMDANPNATVYLGVKTGIDSKKMISDLQKAQDTNSIFEVANYVNQFPAKKHDHFLIPNGTIHCSGANGMVLEISATPYIFTFKLYDWGRLGLDGAPRPINIQHGAQVIQWNRDTEYCIGNLVNQIKLIAEGDGWREERTGLHKNEFIETRRHWFTKKVSHHTRNSVNVLTLVEGTQVVVESPSNTFNPFEVHYAETFIVPAIVGEYTIRPFGVSENQMCATIKAYVRY